jgi:carbamoylphosphate synthase large subunit
MKKLMLLGAGSCQLNAIKRIKELGYQAIVSDNRLDSPGKSIADVSVLADTFSYEETYKWARDLSVDGIMTSGTDQPVLTVNKVAEALSLPQLISTETALGLTNKKYMKEKFTHHGIPTAAYAVVAKNFKEEAVAHIKPPYVVKPLDSQGQRGIYKLETIADIRVHFDKVIQYSKVDEILIESYYENTEVTLTGWVENSKEHVLAITDRVTFKSDEHIGVCLAHECPSRHLDLHKETFIRLTEEICQAFEIHSGPIYFQFLVGDQGVLVNEIAGRIGGAYEDLFIPVITGIDLLKLRILEGVEPTSDRIKEEKEKFNAYSYSENGLRVSVQLFFCKTGQVKSLSSRADLLKNDFILDMGFNIKEGDILSSIENASARAGYVIVTGQSEDILQENLKRTFELLQVIDNTGENLVIDNHRIYRS